MISVTKPHKLSPGDKIATVSLSWGGAGDKDLMWRYQLGKKRLEDEFGLQVVEMKNTLKGSDYLYHHPEKRAEDLMQAFCDPEITGIFSCIGGEESIRLLPYVNFKTIQDNPKVFIGYSDSTATHFMCLKAGLSSFYGASVLGEFAENIKIFDYTTEWIRKTLFQTAEIGPVIQSSEWSGERIEWLECNTSRSKTMKRNQEYEFLQGHGTVRGRLIGGCMEVMEMLKSTALWPSLNAFDDSVLFFETSEDTPKR